MKNPAPTIITKVPSQSEIQFLEDKIYEHNSKMIGKDDGRLFSKWIYDAGRIVGGIYGWIWASACEITLFWVDAEFRRKGFGSALLNAAEEEARNAGCAVVQLRTYSFQAPEFYVKQGYTVDHETNNFPNGYSDYSMIKRFKT